MFKLINDKLRAEFGKGAALSISVINQSMANLLYSPLYVVGLMMMISGCWLFISWGTLIPDGLGEVPEVIFMRIAPIFLGCLGVSLIYRERLLKIAAVAESNKHLKNVAPIKINPIRNLILNAIIRSSVVFFWVLLYSSVLIGLLLIIHHLFPDFVKLTTVKDGSQEQYDKLHDLKSPLFMVLMMYSYNAICSWSSRYMISVSFSVFKTNNLSSPSLFYATLVGFVAYFLQNLGVSFPVSISIFVAIYNAYIISSDLGVFTSIRGSVYYIAKPKRLPV